MAKLKAVILAAGSGNRIAKLAKDTPKPLLSLDGAPGSDCFLDFHLKSLTQAGVEEIFLVGNDRTHGTHLNAMKESSASWILNPTKDLSTSGSGHSAWFAWHSPHNILDGSSRVVLMDADIVYDFSVLERLFSQNTRSKTLVSPHFNEDNEEVLVFGKDDRPVRHGKNLARTPAVASLECLGEATGMLLWEPSEHEALRQTTDRCIEQSTTAEHEDVTQKMMDQNLMSSVKLLPAQHFMEVDTPEDYRELTQRIIHELDGPVGLSLSRRIKSDRP